MYTYKSYKSDDEKVENTFYYCNVYKNGRIVGCAEFNLYYEDEDEQKTTKAPTTKKPITTTVANPTGAKKV